MANAVKIIFQTLKYLAFVGAGIVALVLFWAILDMLFFNRCRTRRQQNKQNAQNDKTDTTPSNQALTERPSRERDLELGSSVINSLPEMGNIYQVPPPRVHFPNSRVEGDFI